MKILEPIRLCFCGDVMTGRGIDQALPHPGRWELHEPYVRDARWYLHNAEKANGPIPYPVRPEYIWGEALAVLNHSRADLRIINLETSITTSEHYWPEKEIHYRMHPRNIGCITAASIDCCCLANNHVLDWGCDGLLETLHVLERAGVAHAGAGKNLEEARAPAVLEIRGRARVLVFSYGLRTSGIPWDWAAAANRSGVNYLDDLSDETSLRIAEEMRRWRREGDVLVASIHWGPNWGYELRADEIRFAHRLIELGVDVLHGHSSHHVKTAEIYGERLILYGCGDFITDYEGISGYEEFRNDLSLVYMAELEPGSGRVLHVRLIPMRMAGFQLHRATAADARWLCNLLSKLGAPAATGVDLSADGSLILRAR